MKHLIIMFAALSLTLGCSEPKGTVGSGVLVTDERKLDRFSFVQFVGGGQVIIKQSKTNKALLTWDDNLITNVSTKVEGPMLIIAPTGRTTSRQGLKAEIHTSALAGVAIDGGATLVTEAFNSTNFLIRITGAGKISTSGTTEKLEVKIDGAGNIDTTGLKSKDANVTIMGAGNVRVHSTNQLAAKITGAGTIRYMGNPKKVLKTVTGAGSVSPL